MFSSIDDGCYLTVSLPNYACNYSACFFPEVVRLTCHSSRAVSQPSMNPSEKLLLRSQPEESRPWGDSSPDKGRFLMINMEEPCSLGWKKIRRLGWVAVPHRLQSRISGCQLELPNPTFLVMLGFACQCRNRVFVKYHIPEVWIYHDGRQICNPEKPGFFHAAQPQPTDLDFF